MKKKLIAVLLCGVITATPVLAQEEPGPLAVAVDAVVVRPASLVVTVLGAGLFVVALPFSVPSKSVGKTANALIGYPGRMTFVRPLGDLDSLEFPEQGTARSEDSGEGNFSDLPADK